MQRLNKDIKNIPDVLSRSFCLIAAYQGIHLPLLPYGGEGFVVYNGSPSPPHWNSMPASKREVNDKTFTLKITPGTVPPRQPGSVLKHRKVGIGIKAAIKGDSERIA